jgi:hypothetical protein
MPIRKTFLAGDWQAGNLCAFSLEGINCRMSAVAALCAKVRDKLRHACAKLGLVVQDGFASPIADGDGTVRIPSK